MTDSTEKILVLEPNQVQGEVTAFRLRLLGYRAQWIKSGLDFWSTLYMEHPDALIISLDGAPKDGLDVLEQLGSDQRTSHIPVMVTSMKAELDLVEKAWKLGGRDFLVTPFDPAMLEQKVAKLMERRVKIEAEENMVA